MKSIRLEEVDQDEILRYLGYNGPVLGEDWIGQLEDAIADCLEHSRPQYEWREFQIESLSQCVGLNGVSTPLEGDSIKAHLHGAMSVIFLAATLGIGMEKRMQTLRHTDMTKLLLVDASASACIEAVCNQAEEEIRGVVIKSGNYLGSRFSPGYGDFPMSFQPTLLRVLDAEKRLGLTVTSSHLLIPRKSVTAVMGVFAKQELIPARNPCEACLMRETCVKRKDGIFCGYPKTHG